MKPLAHWAIHKKRTLRLRGRSATEIWGLLVAPDGTEQSFRFDRQTLQLLIGEGGAASAIKLDPYGFEQATDEESGR